MSSNLNEYKLSCEILGHSSDVRSVVQAGSPNIILSGSRDKTAKIWTRTEGEGNYKETASFANHSKFISCVYYLESEKWICTGSNDSKICIYNEGSTTPHVILEGHDECVCTIYKGLQPKSIISGSWDKTAKVWCIDNSGAYTSISLDGHEAAVWAVVSMPTQNYVTGSADKNIFVWNSKGEKARVLKGHTDCVRGLISMGDGSLLSCGNDAVIRHWNNEGECVKEIHGHTNYIYCISSNSLLGDDVFVSGGEDSTICMWSVQSGILGDPITLPAQSVWTVACLSNGDIVTGSSDGVLRIFTKDPARFADPEVIEQFSLAVQTRIMEKSSTLGGIKKNDLPGPESLLKAGTEGQTKLVRLTDGKIVCFQWENNQWNMVGDVMGASGGSQGSSGKILYEGKEYDFVFSVDISDSEPPIKLPYNNGDDPWQTAQKFIHKHNLPQVYLDEVANFIVKSAKSPGGQENNSNYRDPFTGEARYVPGTSANNFQSSGNVDPFTGSSSYATAASQSTKLQSTHFPFKNYLTFDNCDLKKVLEKLREFNLKTGDSKLSVDENMLQSVILLADKKLDPGSAAVAGLLDLLQWPKEILFPVLDVARLSIRNEHIFISLNPNTFLDRILENLDGVAANQLMSVRCLVNLMVHNTGRQNILVQLEKIVKSLKNIQTGSINLQLAIATFYLNVSVAQVNEAEKLRCLVIAEGVLDLLKWSADLETSYRSLQALGNLSCTTFGQIVYNQIMSAGYGMDKICDLATARHQIGFEKINECANSLIAKF